MSEVQSRPAAATRGRGSHRGGRGGFGSRSSGRPVSKQANGEGLPEQLTAEALDEQGELGQLKKYYLVQLETLKELFPDWTNDDLVFALQETDGDLPSTIERISEGNVSKFVVQKKVEKKPKSTKETSVSAAREPGAGSLRGSRGRGGLESGRGGRGRATERGRGGARGGRSAAVAAATTAAATVPAEGTVSVPTAESNAWTATTSAPAESTNDDSNVAAAGTSAAWPSATASTTAPATDSTAGQRSSLIPEGTKKSWASMLAQPKPTPPSAAPKATATSTASGKPKPVAEDTAAHEIPATTITPPDPAAADSTTDGQDLAAGGDTYANYELSADDNLIIAPPKVPLTEDNVEALPDVSIPPQTETVASTRDAGSAVGALTPLATPGASSASQLHSQQQGSLGGFATSAWKSGALGGRSSSFQRKMMEQREAVVMPLSHSVDRATVQFGSMGLNGDNDPLDVDDEREAAETRAQPQQSPPSQPRTSLPPAPHQGQSHQQQQSSQHLGSDQTASAVDAIPTPKPAPGLTATSQAQAAAMGLPAQAPPPGITQHMNQPYGSQYGRYGASGLGHEGSQPNQKAYDPFSQQPNYASGQQDQQGIYGSQSQSTNPQTGGPSQAAAYSQGSSDYSQYATEQSRSGYGSYYGGPYGQPGAGAQQEQNAPPQRSASGIGSSEATHAASQSSASRFGEAQGSGSNTPNPSSQHTQPQHSASQPQNIHHHQQQHHHNQSAHNYQQYANPYYSGSYYGTYMNQYPQYNYNHQGYGAPYGGKGNMYGQPHHGYGMSPQTSYEHSSSPANVSGFGGSSVPGRDSGFSSGFSEYGRSGSAQASQSQQHGTSGTGFPSSVSESYGSRTTSSGFMSNDARVQYAAAQQAAAEDSGKSYQEKPGQSPAPGQPGRSASSTNNTGYGAHQSNFPPPQGQQQGYSGYPGQMNQVHGSHASQYPHLGGLGQPQSSGQSQGAGSYGSYGAGFGSSGYGSYGRGGWSGSNYAQH